jgi:hypothetical protein
MHCPCRDAHVRHVRRRLLQEGVDQGGFPKARLPGEQDDLSLVAQRLMQAIPQRPEHALSAHQATGGGLHRLDRMGRGAVTDRGDKPVPTPGQGLNKPRGLRTIPERAADLEDAAFQDLRLDVRLGPRRLKELLLRHQPSSMLHQIAQDGKRFGRQQQTLGLGGLPEAPQTLVDGVQPEWGKVLHDRLLQCWCDVLRGRWPGLRRAPAVRAWHSPCDVFQRPRIAQNDFVTLL